MAMATQEPWETGTSYRISASKPSGRVIPVSGSSRVLISPLADTSERIGSKKMKLSRTIPLILAAKTLTAIHGFG
jgi:hypothetical protein